VSVRLLFDQNLSFRLARVLDDVYPGSAHVRPLGMDQADDIVIWQYAAANGFVIVSKDSDFYQRSQLYGPPPKVVWLRVGNGSTREVADLLRSRVADVEAFADDDSSTFLALS
jgi:predicted nuclease of predicted toxin-antitoxin system